GRVLAHAETIGAPVWDAAGAPQEIPGLSVAAVKALRRFMDTMAELRTLAAAAPVGELLEAVLDRSGYLDALAAERTIEAQGRVENLEALVDMAREFDA